MFKILIFIVVVIVALITIYKAHIVQTDIPDALVLEHGDEIRSVSFDGVVFDVQVARTKQERQRGLMQEKSLCQACGMLFLFPEDGMYPFWMKDTPTALDIIWIKDGVIVWIAQNTTPYSEALIMPESTADTVLEIHAGMTQKHHIVVGDMMMTLQ